MKRRHNRRFGVDLSEPPIVATFHPVTQEFEDTGRQIDELLAALAPIDAPILFTYPNSDTSGRIIIERIEQLAARRPRTRAVPNLGSAAYYTLLGHARAMVGNSSSGVLEAASFRLPVVNVGTRQQGRPQPANVIQTDPQRDQITAGLRRALSSEFAASLSDLINPYGDGHAAQRIVSVLQSLELNDLLVRKGFHDQPRLAA
jgi:UDP-hydrolysing UDP-N-acetyl-D-glucosamine 2-epimerase